MPQQFDCEYIVVGSGAGGGTVAARLAEAGHSVILLEAGGDPRKLTGGDPLQPGGNRLPSDYDVPAFHGFASENEAMRWDFFVRHYTDDGTQKLDWKYIDEWNGRKAEGILYPRAGTVGGCTAHNAQIFVCPHNSDWEYIAELTNDPSWLNVSESVDSRRGRKCRRQGRNPRSCCLARMGLCRSDLPNCAAARLQITGRITLSFLYIGVVSFRTTN